MARTTPLPGTATQNSLGYSMNVPTKAPAVSSTEVTSPYTGFTSAQGPATVTTTPVISSKPAIDQVNKMTNVATQTQAQIDAAALAAKEKATADALAKSKLPAPTPKVPLTPEQYAMSLPDTGYKFIYNTKTGQEEQIALDQQVPSGYTTIDVKNAPGVETTTSADGNITFKQLPDGTYGKYDSTTGEYMGMSNANQFNLMKTGQASAKAYQDAVANGPMLTENQKAIIKGIQDTYQRLIDTQNVMNKNAEGSTAVYQNLFGFAGTKMSADAIRSEAEKGAAKIADLNSKMASDVAKMTNALQQDNLAVLKDAYQSFQTNSATLQKEIDTQHENARLAADKAQQQRETAENAITNDINTFQNEVAKAGGPEDPVAYATALSNGDYSGMVKAAGNILTGGIGGEYNIYKKDMVARGLKPLSFDAYQTADANRKARIAAAGATRMGGTQGLTKDELKVINGVNAVITSSPVYKTVQSAQAFVDGVKSSLAEGTGLGDIAAINQFQKVIDEGAVTRDQDVKLVLGAQTVMDRLNTWKKRNIDTGEVMSDELRDQMNSVMASLLDVKKQRLLSSPEIASQLRIAAKTGISPEDTIIGAIQSPAIPTVGEEHMQEAVNKKTGLLDWSKADAKNTTVMNSLRTAFPNASPEEIYDKLKAKGYIK